MVNSRIIIRTCNIKRREKDVQREALNPGKTSEKDKSSQPLSQIIHITSNIIIIIAMH